MYKYNLLIKISFSTYYLYSSFIIDYRYELGGFVERTPRFIRSISGVVVRKALLFQYLALYKYCWCSVYKGTLLKPGAMCRSDYFSVESQLMLDLNRPVINAFVFSNDNCKSILTRIGMMKEIRCNNKIILEKK